MAVDIFSPFAFVRVRARTAQVIRFLGAGGIATLLHWGVMAALMWGGVRALTATVIGAVAGALGNYGLQSRWVFAPARRRIASYVCVVLLCWGVNAGGFWTLAVAAHMPVVLAQLAAHAGVATMSFLLYKYVVFHEYAD